jgi:hypothetical protein
LCGFALYFWGVLFGLFGFKLKPLILCGGILFKELFSDGLISSYR